VLERTPGVDHVMVSYATGRRVDPLGPAPHRPHRARGAHRGPGVSPRALGEESAPDRDLMVRLGVAAFCAMNLMLLYASLYTGWFDAMEPRFAALFRWLSLLLATPVAFWCAAPFFAGAVAGLRRRVLHMDLPIALGVAILYRTRRRHDDHRARGLPRLARHAGGPAACRAHAREPRPAPGRGSGDVARGHRPAHGAPASR
jgi:cation transport ATPase